MGTLMWLIPTLVSIAGWAFAFRRIAGQLAWHFRATYMVYSYDKRRDMPSGEQWFLAILCASVLAIVWPISIPVAYGLEGARKGGGFFHCPRDQRAAIQARRIAELEKAAGIYVP